MMLHFPSTWTWMQLAQEKLQIFISQSSLSKTKAEGSKIKTFTQEELSSISQSTMARFIVFFSCGSEIGCLGTSVLSVLHKQTLRQG